MTCCLPTAHRAISCGLHWVLLRLATVNLLQRFEKKQKFERVEMESFVSLRAQD
jgi:hypothetical protein